MNTYRSKLVRTLNRRRRVWPALVLATFAAAVFPAGASAGLTLLKPSSTDPATFQGKGGYSADGLGQSGANGGTIQAEVPAGSTVAQAYLYGTYFVLDPTPAQIDFDGTIVTLTKISDVGGLSTARADVTAQVAAKVTPAGGITNFAVNTDPFGLDGVGLVVIYANTTSPFTTVAVLDGSASQTGDSATFNFANPLDKTVPGFAATMSVGSGFSYQGTTGGHACGLGQFSVITVNTQLLSGCAGHYDDGDGGGSGLITVGGVGDSTANPSPPASPPDDDELYDLASFLAQGDNAVTIDSSNPSQNDNLFLAVIAITAKASVSPENCSNGIDDDGDGLADGRDPDCFVTPEEICDNGIDDDGDELVDADDPDCPPLPAGRWMTGGGSLKGGKSTTMRHGFTLPCAVATNRPARLEVNWDQNRFHLTSLTSAGCSDDPAISEGHPVAGFDTHNGRGTGRYNGVQGATASWVIKDAGEPGKQDTLQITIKDAGGNVVLSTSGKLNNGNHQAHDQP
jgi:hypothetical protein